MVAVLSCVRTDDDVLMKGMYGGSFMSFFLFLRQHACSSFRARHLDFQNFRKISQDAFFCLQVLSTEASLIFPYGQNAFSFFIFFGRKMFLIYMKILKQH